MVSVITVAYNDLANLQRTVESVNHLNKRTHLQFIVIDGGSTDGTADYLASVGSLVDRWISEPDTGIYDAMNKGIDLATGDWLIFMNAGDCFYRPDTLEHIDLAAHSDAAVLYGATYRRQRQVVTPPQPLRRIESGLSIGCHQSMFFNYRLLGNHDMQYDANLDFAGDTELLTRLYYLGYSFCALEAVIADFDEMGISSTGQIPRAQLWTNRRLKYWRIFNYFGFRGVVRSILARIFPPS